MTREISGFGKQDWATPGHLFAQWHAEAGFTVDLCAASYNAKLPVYVDEKTNLFSLSGKLRGHRGFINPPYEAIEDFLGFCFREAAHGLLSWHLLPANTDTEWFHKYAAKGQVDLFKGRIPFDDVTPPEIEAKRLVNRLTTKFRSSDLSAFTAVWQELINRREAAHYRDEQLVDEETLKAVNKILQHPELPPYPWKTRAELTKSGPGFPSMIVIFDPNAPVGPHPFRQRDAKTGMLM